MEKGKTSTGKKLGITFGGLFVAGAIVATVLYFTAMGGLRAKQYVESGKKYMEQKMYYEAMAEYETAIEMDKSCVEAYIGLADAYIAEYDVEMAIETLIEARKNCSDSAIEKKLKELKEENADDICDLSEDGIVYHEYAKPEYGKAPVCDNCGHEDSSRKMSYFDDKEISYYNHYLKEFMAHYVICNSYDFMYHKIKQSPETVEVSLVHNGDGTKTYYIETRMTLEQEEDMYTIFFSGGLADFYSGQMLNSKSMVGDGSYDTSQTFEYGGESVTLNWTTSVRWETVSYTAYTCVENYVITCPEDYDGLIYVSKKIAHWITKEQNEAELAAGLRTDTSYVDDRGMFNEYEKTGIFFRIKGDFEKEAKEDDEE